MPFHGRRLLFMLPVVLFVVLAGFFFKGLYLDPAHVPTALADKAVPAFDLPALDEKTQGFASTDLTGTVSVVNIFASWCVPCRVEHPLLMELAKNENAKLYGIAYKDKVDATRKFLDELGDPYLRIGADLDGRVGIDLGVYGVPETFIIGPDGRIRYKHVGPLSAKDVDKLIRPLIESLSP